MPRPLGFVVGLKAEAKLLRALPGLIAVGGGGRAGAQVAAESLIVRGVSGLISFGLAGGLDLALQPGALLVPDAVLTGGRRYACDAGLMAALMPITPSVMAANAAIHVMLEHDRPDRRRSGRSCSQIKAERHRFVAGQADTALAGKAVGGAHDMPGSSCAQGVDGRLCGHDIGGGDSPTTTIYGGSQILAEAAAKAHLFSETGAAAVDLESGAVALVADKHKLPFAVLRAVCDPAGRDLPPAAMIALDAGGEIKAARILASLLRHPGQIRTLLHLSNDARHARAMLVRQVRAIQPSFAAAACAAANRATGTR